MINGLVSSRQHQQSLKLSATITIVSLQGHGLCEATATLAYPVTAERNPTRTSVHGIYEVVSFTIIPQD